EPPQTEPPQTEPPQTEPPQTEPPQTEPPQTEPPQTEPPYMEPPQAEDPYDDGYRDGWGYDGEPIYSGGGYILPSSSSEILTRDSLVGMSLDDLYLARNEIFARHGRMFDDPWLQSYFNSQSWYQPLYSPSEFSYDWLSSVEMQNVNTILEYEAELGA
ncbi:MAG: YARHG domain-containing protein, partial [Robinsoniella sp.]|nr:YARHG domain-containing protein [Robinsoniella sp.]